jgi:hypothetical protein
MKLITVLIIALFISGCASNKGLVSLDQIKEHELNLSPIENRQTKIVIIRDEPTRQSVLPVLTSWFSENNFIISVVNSVDEATDKDNLFTYRAWWGWDMALYMRRVEMRLESAGNVLGSLKFDAVQYGAFGKFGNGEQRLRILLDALFGKITEDQANQMLGDV